MAGLAIRTRQAGAGHRVRPSRWFGFSGSLPSTSAIRRLPHPQRSAPLPARPCNRLESLPVATSFDLTIKNYRCFADEEPARISVRPGFTAFLGPNNAGKSTMLRLFYELRTLFEMAGTVEQ